MPDLHLYHLRLDTYVGPLHLKLKLRLTSPWTVLFGPSGSGKSSILRAICGLAPHTDIDSAFCASETPTIPIVELDGNHGRTLPHRRNLAYAPQGAVLFPHLTVAENVAFATNIRHQPDQELVDAALNLFRLAPLAHRLPSALSGGERQRVALARALAVPAPRLMLLDEPFTGLDRALRDELLPQIAAHLAARSIPVLSVTHDVEEALLLDAEVIRLHEGRITAQGPASEVLANERLRILQTIGSTSP